ncbi:MAG: hypothetical protein R3350_09735, partial [Saprospiraceae bacterium]|nr:hypothetical protein [Saprospiraceae bacterium]
MKGKRSGWYFLLALLGSVLMPSISAAQQLEGLWEGTLTQDSRPDTFHYRIQLNQTGDAVSGSSLSYDRDSST